MHRRRPESCGRSRSTGHIASDLTPCGRKVCADVAVAGEMYRHLPVPTTINTLETKKGFEVGVWFKQGEQTPHAIRPHFVEQWSYAMLVVMALVSGVLGFILIGLVAVVLDQFVLDGIEDRARRRAANPTSHTEAKKAKKAKKDKPALWSGSSRSWA